MNIIRKLWRQHVAWRAFERDFDRRCAEFRAGSERRARVERATWHIAHCIKRDLRAQQARS